MIDPINIQVVVLQVWPLCQRCHKASQSHAIAIDLNGYTAEEGRYCEDCAYKKVVEIKKAQLPVILKTQATLGCLPCKGGSRESQRDLNEA